MSARSDVLARVRDALGKARAAPATIAAEARDLIDDLSRVRPAIEDSEAVALFIRKASSDSVTATVERLDGPAALPGAVRTYLDRNGLGRSLAVGLPTALRALDWSGLALEDVIDPNAPVALTFADAAIAETGTLVFPSSPAVPNLFNFLALHHLAVVHSGDIVPFLEDVWPRFADTLPRALTLVTGTSGTADIEGQNIRGAHGPRFLHIFIIDTA